MNLLVDIGNTRLKWGMATEGAIITGKPLMHHQLSRQPLLAAWKSIGLPERMAICCVSAKQLLMQVCSVAEELWPDMDIVFVKSQASACGVYNAYQQPEKLGVDRWLSLLAVRRHYQQAVCIVDCGTAITLDLMDAQGQHQGGMICPGLTLMKKSLHQGTENLQLSETHYTVGLANFTEAAIYSGTLSAAVGLIEHVLAKQPENTQLILTGGDAELIANQLALKAQIDPDLVLRGLDMVLTG
jgi:type III pantothenate kinase